MKKNNNVDDKSRFYMAIAVSISLIAIAFFVGYRNMESKATSIEAENQNLRTRIAALQMYYDTEEQNIKDTESMTEAIKNIFASYSGSARYEDGIYEAFNLHGASGNVFDLTQIGFATPENISVIPADVVNAAQIEGYDQEIRFRKFDVSYEGRVSYEGLKGMIDQVLTGNYDLAIGNMSYHLNEEGYVEGESLLSFYYVQGAGCDYEQPQVVEYETGLSNLFGVTTSVEAD
jgi:hypothetical protein